MKLLAVTWDVDPIFINIFGIDIAWYGVLWVSAFVVGLMIFGKIVKREKLDPQITDSAFIIMIISTVIGARLGHCLFYDPLTYLANPIEILYFREGGMASHGAAIGLLIGIWIFCRKWKLPYVWMLDRIGIVVASGAVLIRLGNLVNSEVYGTATELPWGFIFVRMGETTPMHPTQIYEALAYFVIFLILGHIYWRTNLSNRRGFMFGLFLVLLFGFRFFIESIKQVQAEFELGMTINMGQILSIPFIVAGLVILGYSLNRPSRAYTNMPLAINSKPQTKSKKR